MTLPGMEIVDGLSTRLIVVGEYAHNFVLVHPQDITERNDPKAVAEYCRKVYKEYGPKTSIHFGGKGVDDSPLGIFEIPVCRDWARTFVEEGGLTYLNCDFVLEGPGGVKIEIDIPNQILIALTSGLYQTMIVDKDEDRTTDNSGFLVNIQPAKVVALVKKYEKKEDP